MNGTSRKIALALSGFAILEAAVYLLLGGTLREVASSSRAFLLGESFTWSPFLHGLGWSMLFCFLIGIVGGPKEESSSNQPPKDAVLEESQEPEDSPSVEEEEKPKASTDKAENKAVIQKKERLKRGRLFGKK